MPTTRQLIAWLQELDPTGDTPVCISNEDFLEPSLEPAYYDGNLQILTPHPEGFCPVEGTIMERGSKIVLTPISINELIRDNRNFKVNYETPRVRQMYEDDYEKARLEGVEEEERLEKELFMNWAETCEIPLAEAESLYVDWNISANDNITVKLGLSYNDSRRIQWTERYEAELNHDSSATP